ncbi:prepilin-type N-terminal cleavage/methylation domain-containing protein [Moritella sp. 24]|uniref:type II secretion system protein n=1 Tax=Moritella sp. 24 TaxID=2746230 RepID=UPI001BAA4FF4|nr:prepilin-type N-terminal cleavage/methylation domain-containing protein [Moritella sp. 24]QUM75764.1 prepilin-type N-terminal cleavage/methylation domain-containing protein [Moritella sp. 24]
MHKNKGFTLIELVIVIIVLGILAAVAIPRFINVQQDARIATIKGIAGNFSFVVEQVNYASIMQGLEGQRAVKVSVGDVEVNTYFGKPQEIWDDALGNLMNSNVHYLGNGYKTPTVLDKECTESSVCVVDQTRVAGVISGYPGWGMFFVPNGKSVNDLCFAFYAFSENGTAVTSSEVSTVESGCN